SFDLNAVGRAIGIQVHAVLQCWVATHFRARWGAVDHARLHASTHLGGIATVTTAATGLVAIGGTTRTTCGAFTHGTTECFFLGLAFGIRLGLGGSFSTGFALSVCLGFGLGVRFGLGFSIGLGLALSVCLGFGVGLCFGLAVGFRLGFGFSLGFLLAFLFLLFLLFAFASFSG